MDVKIGVVFAPRELVLEVNDSAAEVTATVEAVLSGGVPVLWLTDAKGKRVGVPADRIAYVEVGADEAARQVGFGRS